MPVRNPIFILRGGRASVAKAIAVKRADKVSVRRMAYEVTAAKQEKASPGCRAQWQTRLA
jgi:hypothetical protein